MGSPPSSSKLICPGNIPSKASENRQTPVLMYIFLNFSLFLDIECLIAEECVWK